MGESMSAQGVRPRRKHDCGVLISIKRGAWFERPNERGWTHLAESHLRQNLISWLENLGVRSFSVLTETTVDRVRLAIFLPCDMARIVMPANRQKGSQPTFTIEGIRREARVLRGEWKSVLNDPLFRAKRSLSASLPLPNHEVLAPPARLRRSRLPSPSRLRTYWLRLVTTSRIDARLFGAWPSSSVRELSRLKRAFRAKPTRTWAVSNVREVRLPRLHGTAWRESCFHPMYAVLDTVMTLRARRMRLRLLRYDRGPWRGFAILGRESDAAKFFNAPVSRREWGHAKRALLRFLNGLRNPTGRDEGVFYHDDFDAVAFGPFHVRSFNDFQKLIKSSMYATFTDYFDKTLGRGPVRKAHSA